MRECCRTDISQANFVNFANWLGSSWEGVNDIFKIRGSSEGMLWQANCEFHMQFCEFYNWSWG